MNAGSIYFDSNANKKLPHNNLVERNKIKTSTGFIIVCAVVFIISVAVTVYFSVTMNAGMPMPGGWSMSMMWMRMPGTTWLSSFVSFIIMWFAMMLVMMMPSALPMFLKINGRFNFLCFVTTGYFTIWLLAGVIIYIPGVMLANASMYSETLSSRAPLLFGITLVLAGAYQFSRIKIKNLMHCRSPFGCSMLKGEHEKGFMLGCRQGIVCCTCCAGLMIVQLVVGIMNPAIMIIIAVAIAAEKLLPRPQLIVRLFGLALIITGFIIAI